MSVKLSKSDVDAIARVVQSEVGFTPAASRPAQINAVVSTILNRANTNFSENGGILGQLNARHQFSAVSGIPTAVGDARRLPAAPASIMDAVKRELGQIFAGNPAKPFTHFANPDVSDLANRNGWIRGMQGFPDSVTIGDPRAHNYHVYGRAPPFPGAPEPPAPPAIDLQMARNTLYPGQAADTIDRNAQADAQAHALSIAASPVSDFRDPRRGMPSDMAGHPLSLTLQGPPRAFTPPGQQPAQSAMAQAGGAPRPFGFGAPAAPAATGFASPVPMPTPQDVSNATPMRNPWGAQFAGGIGTDPGTGPFQGPSSGKPMSFPGTSGFSWSPPSPVSPPGPGLGALAASRMPQQSYDPLSSVSPPQAPQSTAREFSPPGFQAPMNAFSQMSPSLSPTSAPPMQPPSAPPQAPSLSGAMGSLPAMPGMPTSASMLGIGSAMAGPFAPALGSLGPLAGMGIGAMQAPSVMGMAPNTGAPQVGPHPLTGMQAPLPAIPTPFTPPAISLPHRPVNVSGTVAGFGTPPAISHPLLQRLQQLIPHLPSFLSTPVTQARQAVGGFLNGTTSPTNTNSLPFGNVGWGGWSQGPNVGGGFNFGGGWDTGSINGQTDRSLH